MKKCPYCAEEIQDEAIVCRYCWRDLTVVPRRARSATGRLMSTIEYALNWLKLNDPDLYKGIVAKMAEIESKPITVKLSQKQMQPTE
jgi:hypothetical protein